MHVMAVWHCLFNCCVCDYFRVDVQQRSPLWDHSWIGGVRKKTPSSDIEHDAF